MLERKCLACNVWNNDEDYCLNCKEPISPLALDKAKEEKRKIALASMPVSKLDVLLEKAKTSKYLIVRMLYFTFYSVFLLIGGIGAFLAWLTAMANG